VGFTAIFEMDGPPITLKGDARLPTARDEAGILSRLECRDEHDVGAHDLEANEIEYGMVERAVRACRVLRIRYFRSTAFHREKPTSEVPDIRRSQIVDIQD